MSTRNILILQKLCLICKIPNMYHRVFWNPAYNGYSQQHIESDSYWTTDHYAIIDNLMYLEIKLAEKESHVSL